jgi:hypothetical protein
MASPDQEQRRFLIPISLVTQAKARGVGLDRLQEMVRLSARCTHPLGNRRFEDFVFMVEGKRVVSLYLDGEYLELPPEETNYRCYTCKDTNRVQVFDQCGHCDGTGCNKCDQGLVPSSIPCPACEQNRRLSMR